MTAIRFTHGLKNLETICAFVEGESSRVRALAAQDRFDEAFGALHNKCCDKC
jgi:hypothetical protein